MLTLLGFLVVFFIVFFFFFFIDITAVQQDL